MKNQENVSVVKKGRPKGSKNKAKVLVTGDVHGSVKDLPHVNVKSLEVVLVGDKKDDNEQKSKNALDDHYDSYGEIKDFDFSPFGLSKDQIDSLSLSFENKSFERLFEDFPDDL